MTDPELRRAGACGARDLVYGKDGRVGALDPLV
jgi:hypothetical protein